MERDNIWASYDEGRLEELEKINGLYRECLDQGKTERECVTLTIRMAEEKGYRDLRQLIKDGTEVKAGDKIYAVCMDKSIALFNIGSRPLEEGMNILGAHIDSPRIAVKQNPLYESDELAYLDTHYYGGIKKYQWVTPVSYTHLDVYKRQVDTPFFHLYLSVFPCPCLRKDRWW